MLRISRHFSDKQDSRHETVCLTGWLSHPASFDDVGIHRVCLQDAGVYRAWHRDVGIRQTCLQDAVDCDLHVMKIPSLGQSEEMVASLENFLVGHYRGMEKHWCYDWSRATLAYGPQVAVTHGRRCRDAIMLAGHCQDAVMHERGRRDVVTRGRSPLHPATHAVNRECHPRDEDNHIVEAVRR